MRAGILTLFVITTEFSLIFRGKCDGCKEPDQRPNTKPVGNSSYTSQSRFRMECINDYVRKAGTSNLFQCVFINDAYEWKNIPRLDCIPDPKRRTTQVTHTPSHTSGPPPIAPSSTPAVKTTTTRQSSPTTPGHIGFTTTHAVTKATGTAIYSTVRTTAKGEEPMTTANRTVISSPSTLTVRKYPSTESPEFKYSGSISSTTAGNGDNDVHHDPYKGGITTGVVFVLIVVLGATVALLLWCRRRQVSSTQTLEMTPQRPESDYSLLNPASGTRSNPSDTSQETPVY
ncbi:uncharacterized protein LOC143500351 isoform X1 [Brachyhypopomus gauderio]|uniref:uncharacterized protein LOC143500351 isoform X1 n=1 Tax=Brachyhypopomus gauderio TaxID=698409 RepID=UPI004041FFCD